MSKNEILVGLDIGTTKVAAVVGEIIDEEIRIIGVGEVSSTGLRKGAIIDIEGVVNSINEAVAAAEHMSGISIDHCLVGITGTHIASLNNKGVVAASGANGEISNEDVKRVLSNAKVISLSPDRNIIHIIPREYILDGYNGIVDPAGMSGSRLEVETNIVTGSSAAIKNTLRSIEKAGLKVQELVLNPMASAEAVLLPAERELAAIVVDIGGGTTDIAIFDNNGLYFSSVVPLGGQHITSDLAVGLRTPIYKAEEIKKMYGCVLPELVSDNEYIEITNVGGQATKNVSKKMIASIIESRALEILSMIKVEINKSGFKGLIPGGIIFTGGSSLIDGLEQLAEKELELPARVGSPHKTGGLGDIVNSAAHSTSIGIIRYGTKHFVSSKSDSYQEFFVKRWFERLKTIFKDMF